MAFAKDLRASVLQAAMQGKLTEQLETDTPVSELLADIKAEKDRLIAEKKIKKEKPLSAISDDDIPFDIPESWQWVRFGDIVYYNMGKTPPRAEPEWWKNDCPWVAISDMPESGHISQTKEMVSQKAINEKFSKISPAGTMLMSFKLTVGRVSILDIDAVHNEAIISIYPHCDNEKITQDYLFHLLPYIANAGDTKNAIKGKTLNNDSIRNLIVPYPPIEEQKRIVRRIEEIMIRIDELEAIEEELKKLKEVFPADMKTAILQAAMQGKLTEQLDTDSSVDELLENIKAEREKLVKEGKIKKSKTIQNDNFVAFSDDEMPFEIPDNWRWVRIGSIANCGSGSTPLRSQSQYWTNGEINWLKTGELNNGEIHSSEEKVSQLALKECSLRMCKENDVLIAMYGATIGKLGIAKVPLTTNQACCACTMYGKTNYKFFFYYLMAIKDILIGKAEGGAQPNISREKIIAQLIPIPPLEEQNRIVTKLEQILPLIADLS